jgi:Ras-related protein Rab-1A
MTEIDKFANDNVCKVLVGNKCDLEDRRKVTREEGEEIANTFGIPYIETSAKSNICVEESFQTMAA